MTCSRGTSPCTSTLQLQFHHYFDLPLAVHVGPTPRWGPNRSPKPIMPPADALQAAEGGADAGLPLQPSPVPIKGFHKFVHNLANSMDIGPSLRSTLRGTPSALAALPGAAMNASASAVNADGMPADLVLAIVFLLILIGLILHTYCSRSGASSEEAQMDVEKGDRRMRLMAAALVRASLRESFALHPSRHIELRLCSMRCCCC